MRNILEQYCEQIDENKYVLRRCSYYDIIFEFTNNKSARLYCYMEVDGNKYSIGIFIIDQKLEQFLNSLISDRNT